MRDDMALSVLRQLVELPLNPYGPLPLPLFGNLHTMLAHEPGYDVFDTWKKKYGPVYTYWIGNERSVFYFPNCIT
ncbi:hypothetical protein COOONC_26333 [Cooperia oncophora]